WLSVSFRLCPSAHTGRPWLSVTSVAVHQYTYQHVGPWTQHADPSLIFALLGSLLSTHRTSLGVRHHTQDVCGCLCCPWLFVSTYKTSVVIRVCLWVSASIHRMFVAVCQHTQDVCVCPSAHTRRPCVCVCVHQHTHDVCGLNTGRPWVSVRTHMTSMCVRQHTQDVRGCPSVHISARCTLALPVDCLGDFVPRGLSVQYTQDVFGCPSAHTGRQWMSLCVCVCPTSVAVHVYPCVSVSTHRTSVAVHQYTYQHVGPWTQHPGPSRGLFGRFYPTTHRTSVGVRQHTQDVRGCLWLSVRTHRSSVAVRVC
ncbi:unnamed protein product, partial [Brassica rapa]